MKLRQLFNSYIEYKKCFGRKQEADQFPTVRGFLKKVLGLSDVSDKEVAIALLLICPAKGPSTGKKVLVKKKLNEKSLVYKLLGDHGMKVFKLAISGNNTKKLRDEFFGTSIIKKLWEFIAP